MHFTVLFIEHDKIGFRRTHPIFDTMYLLTPLKIYTLEDLHLQRCKTAPFGEIINQQGLPISRHVNFDFNVYFYLFWVIQCFNHSSKVSYSISSSSSSRPKPHRLNLCRFVGANRFFIKSSLIPPFPDILSCIAL
jgi:hypothetical protein